MGCSISDNEPENIGKRNVSKTPEWLKEKRKEVVRACSPSSHNELTFGRGVLSCCHSLRGKMWQLTAQRKASKQLRTIITSAVNSIPPRTGCAEKSVTVAGGQRDRVPSAGRKQ